MEGLKPKLAQLFSCDMKGITSGEVCRSYCLCESAAKHLVINLGRLLGRELHEKQREIEDKLEPKASEEESLLYLHL